MKRLLMMSVGLILILSIFVPDTMAQRRITPVTAPDAHRQPVDSALILKRQLEQRRARSTHYQGADGRTIMVDTVTGTEWIDSTLLPTQPKMKYPLLYDITIGANIWDPIMRIFNQKYGGIDFVASLNLHNRYFPTIEVGIGMAKNTPSGNNFTYRSPLAPYFKIGADYNFLYNSNPDYKFFAGVRYGFSNFRYEIPEAMLPDDYWGDHVDISIPPTSVTVGWFEIGVGLRVHVWGPISAGWSVKYHTLLHHSSVKTGDPWYIPGYGTFNSSLSGAFIFSYTIGFNKNKTPKTDISDSSSHAADRREHSPRKSSKSSVSPSVNDGITPITEQ